MSSTEAKHRLHTARVSAATSTVMLCMVHAVD